jgi:hypothetical protein
MGATSANCPGPAGDVVVKKPMRSRAALAGEHHNGVTDESSNMGNNDTANRRRLQSRTNGSGPAQNPDRMAGQAGK